MSATRKATKAEIADAIKDAREYLKPGDTIHLILRSRAASGMSRRISPLKLDKDGEALHLDWLASVIVNGRVGPGGGDGVPMSGCGMDMGVALVYELGARLWPEGFECVGKGCPSNDHSNGDRDYSPHHHSAGGYALRHKWL